MTGTENSILAILPHPDDEAFTMGGTLARYANSGVPVNLCTLTRGEHSRHRLIHGITHEQLAAIRSREVQEAAGILGIREHVQADYSDGGLRDLDPRDLERYLARLLERFTPSVILTFDVQGGSGHPDHIVTHAAVKRVFMEMRASHGYPRRMGCTVLPQDRILHWPRKIFGVSRDRIDAVIDVRAWHATEERAIRTHASVAGDVDEHNYDNWMLWDEEYYTFYGEKFDPPVADLFARLESS